MKTARARMIFDCLRQAVQPKGSDLTDGQLLRHYTVHRDETAFAVLVRRHGPMVLAVCGRLLGHAQDAEDAFQASFVILARKGHRIATRQTVGGWLHGVAYRVALDVRRRGARRKSKEQQVEDMPHPLVVQQDDQQELLALLDRELTRLPEKYRLPVVLCELEGRSRKEAARQLGLPEGTLSSRLATARKTLAKRMGGRGPAVTGVSLTALLASEAGAACVSGPLVASTVRAAGGVVSASVAALAEGVLKAMLLTKIKSAALMLLLASALGVGTVGLTYRTATASDASQNKDGLDALRLDVEALQLNLQAVQKRVKTLEAEVQILKAAEQNQNANHKAAEQNQKANHAGQSATPGVPGDAQRFGPVPNTSAPAAESVTTIPAPPPPAPGGSPGGYDAPTPKLGAGPSVAPPGVDSPPVLSRPGAAPPPVKDAEPSPPRAGVGKGDAGARVAATPAANLSATDEDSGIKVELQNGNVVARRANGGPFGNGEFLWKVTLVAPDGAAKSLSIKDSEVQIQHGQGLLRVDLRSGKILDDKEIGVKADSRSDPRTILDLSVSPPVIGTSPPALGGSAPPAAKDNPVILEALDVKHVATTPARLSATDKPSGTTVQLIRDDLLATAADGKLLWKWNNVMSRVGYINALKIIDGKVEIESDTTPPLKVGLRSGKIISDGEAKPEKAEENAEKIKYPGGAK